MTHLAETITQQLQWRYATKKFDSKRKISSDTWKILEQTLVAAPSSFGLQPWRFFVVENEAVRSELRGASWGQSQVTDASHLVVLARRNDLTVADVDAHLARVADVRKVAKESLEGYRSVILGFMKNPQFDPNQWAARQVYIALGMLLSSAALLQIDACPMEGFDATNYDRILKLGEQGYSATVVCALGYRAADDSYASAPKVRFETDRVVTYIR